MSRLLGGRYEILEKIGEGGMALIYKAKCTLLNRYVAIKILKPEYLEDKKFVESFRQESRAAAGLNHPNIVDIYDIGIEGKNIYYIVMEYIEGENLSSIIEREGYLSDDDTIFVAKQIAAALSCAHKNNIIHRDVKPHNIIVDKYGTAKITDFGIAKAVSTTTLVAEQAVMGSVHYSSPEQIKGGYVDAKSDIYSLGIVMYEMVTGKVPFDGDNPVAVAMKHINDEIIPPSRYNQYISRDLENIILKATEKYPSNRFETADELLSALIFISDGNMGYAGAANTDASSADDAFENEVPMDSEPQQESEEPSDEYVEGNTYDGAEEEIDGQYDSSGIWSNSSENESENDGDEELSEQTEEPEEIPNKKEKKKKKKKKKRFFTAGRIFGILFGIAMAALLSFGILKAYDYFTLPEVEVPDLKGMEYEMAEALLEEKGLVLEKGDLVYSAEFLENQICNQNPSPATKLKQGGVIRVDVSKGKTSEGIPNVVGETYQDAIKMISAAGYQVGLVTKQDGDTDEDIVLEQSPEGGTKGSTGTQIDLVVSTGKESKEISMIDVRGSGINEATATLESVGLFLQNIDYDYSDKFGEGKIMGQSYEPGAKLLTGTGINVTISKGKKPFGTSGGNKNTVPLTLDYTISSNEVFTIKINLVQDGSVTLVHNKVHYKENNGEAINITGSGTATVLIYYDDHLASEGIVNFETGTFSQ